MKWRYIIESEDKISAAEEFWGMVNPLMLVLEDIVELCQSSPDWKSSSLDYQNGWYDLSDQILEILEEDGVLPVLNEI